jgi:seryl-tRNA synthetase
MLDIAFIRENPEVVKKAIEQKNVDLDLDLILSLDKEVAQHKTSVQALQADKNAVSKDIPSASNEDRPALIKKSKEIGTQIDELKPTLEESEAKLKDLLLKTPNIPMAEAPVGKGEEDNVVIKTWGEKTEFDFDPLDHVDLLEKHEWADLQRVVKVAGSRSYALKGEMVSLEMALHRFALDKLVERNFTQISVPAICREDALYATGHFPSGREDIYYMERDDLYLAGTAEVVLNSLHADEIIDEADLPITYCGYSPCFRREAGSAGKDVRGLLRVHMFYKSEQYILCKNDPEESAKWHQELLNVAEEILQDLELPYEIVECCTGDMGTGKYRMNDINTWVPSLDAYRETHSCSTLFDWQARRTNIRYRDSDGNVQFVHTLNNTACATPRILVPLLENHQQADGSVKIPEKLRPYMQGKEFIGK